MTSRSTEPLDLLLDAEPSGIAARLTGRALIIEFDRPEQRNAMRLGMWTRIGDLVRAAQIDERVRAIAFRSVTARAFSAGADIGEFADVRSGTENVLAYQRTVCRTEQAIAGSSKPTVALVRGWCMGGGCEIAVACALRIGDGTARFGITPAKLGIVYGQASVARLVQEVGAPWARYLLLLGKTIDAETALRIGLLHEVVPTDEAEGRLRSVMETLAGNAPVSQVGALRFVDRALRGAAAEDVYAEEWYRRSAESEEYRRGVESFLHKTTPDFGLVPWPEEK